MKAVHALAAVAVLATGAVAAQSRLPRASAFDGDDTIRRPSLQQQPTPYTSPSANRQVNGYVKRDGTYVQPYHSTTPDTSRTNNYSTRGNVNPYTGTPGRKSILDD